MKLFVAAVLVGVCGGQTEKPGRSIFISQDELPAMPEPERKGFTTYLNGLRKIFANEENHAKLQELFQDPRMSAFLLQHLHKRPSEPFPSDLSVNYQDKVFSKQEFQAWYPTLAALMKRMGMEPVVAEEWALADTNGDQMVQPSELWAMLRDEADKPFFRSFLTLAFAEATKTPAGPFWSPAKEAAFQSGVWGDIAALPAGEGLSADEMAQISMEVQVGNKPAEKIPVVEATKEKITGQTKDGVKITVPAPDVADDEKPVELETPKGQKMKLPIASVLTAPDKTAEQIVAGLMKVTVTGA